MARRNPRPDSAPLDRRHLLLAGGGALVSGSAGLSPSAQAQTPPAGTDMVVRPQDFGARGDGRTDDTDAILRAWATISAQDWRSPPSANRLPFMSIRRRILDFPPGDYVYSGPGLSLDGGPVRVTGAGSHASRIRLTNPSGWFLDFTGYLDAAAIGDLTVQGGAGAIRFGNGGRTVASAFMIERCRFVDYMVAAITNQGIDQPQLRIRDCQFSCANGAEAIGVALGGLVDAGEIANCDFWQNRYHVVLEAVAKIGGGSYFSIRHNSFLCFRSATERLADIWLIPKPDDAQNAFEGLEIVGNRFGNENRGSGGRFILVADAESPDGRRTGYRHRDQASRGYVQAVRLIGNGVAGAGAPFSTSPLIASWTPNLQNLVIRDNHFSGSQPAFMLGYLTDSAPDQPSAAQTTLFEHTGGGLMELKRYHLSDRSPGLALDPLALLAGEPQVPEYWTTGADDSGFVDLLATRAWAGIEAGPGVAAEELTDAMGGNNAAVLTFRGATDMAAIRFDGAPPVADRPAWVELDICALPARALPGIIISVMDRARRRSWFSRGVSVVDPSWRRLRFLWWPGDLSGLYLLTIRPIAPDFAAGTADRCAIGRPRVYQAREPLPAGHLRTIGSAAGAWNGEHIVLGPWHLWIDEGGVLRIKNGAPGRADDGTPASG